tara:strand:- start:55 stop:546 length:492 start_codon:yes stop_codon:yes gene_type:complete
MRAVVLFFCCLSCFSSSAENIKIGFIDTNQVVISLSQYKSSLEQISIQFEPKKQELLDLFKHIELVRSKIDLIKKSNSVQSLESELQKLSNLEVSFKQETEFWQQNVNNQKIDLLNEIEILVNIAINEYAIRESYDLILYDNIAFVSDKINITQEIISEIEKM